ncbi:Hsp20/alpha crystallin family protein [Corallococcus sp. 4LFB]|uniref:Hsp20/alpha crystallin family protein n=1 Tax=Corallococcus sp. 4LFB TaxID=3383249 RepID=UPI00397495AB
MAMHPIRRARELARSEQSWDPFAQMHELLQTDPMALLRKMVPGGEEGWSLAPDFDVKETQDAYVFKADLPGVKQEDLDVSVTGQRLIISGKRDEEKREEGERYFTYERSHGGFSRTFTVPEGVDVDRVSAELKDGVLVLRIPKRAEAQSKRIPIGGGGAKGKA